jgi:hypothetical protein
MYKHSSALLYHNKHKWKDYGTYRRRQLCCYALGRMDTTPVRASPYQSRIRCSETNHRFKISKTAIGLNELRANCY